MIDEKNFNLLQKDIKNQLSALKKQAFNAGTPMSSIGSGVADCSQAIQNLTSNFHKNLTRQISDLSDAVANQVHAHQLQQRTERPEDYQRIMRDLRNTNAKGFPEELLSDIGYLFKRVK